MEADSILACSVRSCGRPLVRDARTYSCAAGHSFDRARSGYINLLQPQDRRSPAAGDAREAVEARARLLAAGVGSRLIAELVRLAGELAPGSCVVDLGAGSGEVLGALAAARGIAGCGIDLSVAAAEHAARSFPELTWVVANADRTLPVLSASVDLCLSIHGRRNGAEVARVLRPGGRWIVAVPAADDLAELRRAVLGVAPGEAHDGALAPEHLFESIERCEAREVQRLDRAALLDLLRGTYRGLRKSAAERVAGLDDLTVTLASDIRVLTLRDSPRPPPLRGVSG